MVQAAAVAAPDVGRAGRSGGRAPAEAAEAEAGETEAGACGAPPALPSARGAGARAVVVVGADEGKAALCEALALKTGGSG